MKMSNSSENLGGRIKEYRLKADMSQQELAKASGYQSGTAISLIESGARGIGANDIPKFAQALGISGAALLGENTKRVDFSTALRADEALNKKDKKDIQDFYNYVKYRKQ